jgi:hypothetical protein
MKRFYITIITLLTLDFYCSGQSVDSIERELKIRNILWTTPVAKDTKINGLAIGLMAIPWMDAESLKINGLNIDASPFTLIGGIFAIVGTISSPFSSAEKSKSDNPDDIGYRDVFPDSLLGHPATSIKGVSIGLGLFRDYELNGVGVNGLISFTEQTTGFEITGIMNLHYSFNGVLIAGLRNKTTKGKGLQIGLVNSCKEGKLIQIGLINKIGKRVFPIINFRLKKTAPNTVFK